MKVLNKISRHMVIYLLMPLFNQFGARYYLSHRPNFDRRLDRGAFARLVRAWEHGSDSNNRGDWTRLYFLISCAQELEARGIEGAIVELGVYKGASARVLRELMPDRDLYLFDTFEGFAPNDLPDDSMVGMFKGSLESVRALVGDDKVHYCKGFFPETASMLPENTRIALLHLDMDLGVPTLAALERFWDRVVPGGMVVFHDYHDEVWPEIRAVVDEFLEDKQERPAPIPDKSGTGLVIKSMAPITPPPTENA